MDIVKNTNINFLKYKVPAMLISLAIILGGFLSIYLKHGLSYGVDFSGGTAVHMKFRRAASLDEIRKTLAGAGYKDSGVQGFVDPTEVLIRLPQKISSAEQVGTVSRAIVGLMNSSVLKENVPSDKKDLNSTSRSEVEQFIQL